jgi:hypothetical protein
VHLHTHLKELPCLPDTAGSKTHEERGAYTQHCLTRKDTEGGPFKAPRKQLLESLHLIDGNTVIINIMIENEVIIIKIDN